MNWSEKERESLFVTLWKIAFVSSIQFVLFLEQNFSIKYFKTQISSW